MRRVFFVLLGVLLLLVSVPTVIVASPTADVTVTATPDYEGVPLVTCGGAENITSTSAGLIGGITHAGGDTVTVRGFEWGYSAGSYSWSWNESGSFGTGSFDHEITGLEPSTEVFWRAFAVNGNGQGNSTECSFSTLSGIPEAPTNFTATQVGPSSWNLTWVVGVEADITILRGSDGSCASDYTGGYSVYSGNLTYVVMEDISTTFTSYCIRAWSNNQYGYSGDYAEVRFGGTSMLVISLIILSVCLTALFFWRRNIVFAMGSSMSWLALGVLLVVDPGLLGLPSVSETWVQILAYIFFIMAAGCLLWYFANFGKIKITQTDLRTGQTWESYGKPPDTRGKKESRSERVKRERKEKLRKIGRR